MGCECYNQGPTLAYLCCRNLKRQQNNALMINNKMKKWLALTLVYTITISTKSLVGSSAEVVFDSLFSSIHPEWTSFMMYCASDIGLEFFSSIKGNESRYFSNHINQNILTI